MQNRIVLFAKQPGKTSFSSLFTIKHALGTTKVGHTGTLDSFAQGLLVVCTGNLTRLAGRITDFDKKYRAVISFGEETDTLECTGRTVRKTLLPSIDRVKEAVLHYTRTYMQSPPVFSAIHIDGKRASDTVRGGKIPEMPKREVTVFSSEILDILLDGDGLVRAAMVDFHVSKGTYIRSLARDIGEMAGSSAHLSGLLRTRVGSFRVEDAAGFSRLEDFTIQGVLSRSPVPVKPEDKKYGGGGPSGSKKMRKEKKVYVPTEDEILLQKETVQKSIPMSPDLARACGFGVLRLNAGYETWFSNGGKLSSKMFVPSPFSMEEENAAVFLEDGFFAGLLQKDASGFFRYALVNRV